jgi:hypothetical protein
MTRASRRLAVIWGLLAFGSFGASADAEVGRGRVICEISENGESASGMISIQRDGQEVVAGTCGKELNVDAGSYTAVIRLDGALDGPSQQKSLAVSANGKASVKVDFATGTLEVRIASQGKRAAGMVVIKKNGSQIGTLGSGVAAHLSAGTYQVVAKYRSQEKSMGDVTIGPNQRLALDASFE